MTGFIEVPNRGRRFPYTLEDQTLTVYSANSLPLDTPTDLSVFSSNKFLIASETGKSSLVIFFVDHFKTLSVNEFSKNHTLFLLLYHLMLFFQGH